VENEEGEVIYDVKMGVETCGTKKELKVEKGDFDRDPNG